MEKEARLILIGLAISTIAGAKWSRDEWVVTETPKTYVNQEAGVRCIKSRILEPASRIRNDGLGEFEAHLYCLPDQEEEAKRIVWSFLLDRISGISDNVQACYNRLMSVAPGRVSLVREA